MKHFSHVTAKGKQSKATFNRFVIWNAIYERDTVDNQRRKARNINQALKRSTLSAQEREIIKDLLVAEKEFVPLTKRKARAIELTKPPEAHEGEMPQIPVPERAKEGEGGLIVSALVGIDYASKKEPFYGELHATFKFRNRSAYKPELVLDAMVKKMSQLMYEWWENSYAVARLIDLSEILVEGSRGESKFGVIEEKDESVTDSEVEYTFYVSQKKDVDRKAQVKQGKEHNPLDR